MVIWYINHYAKPSPFGTPGRAFYLSKALASFGHEILIICASNHHTRLRPAPFEDIDRIHSYDGINYYHIRTRPYQGNGMVRILNMLDFSWGVAQMTKKIEEGSMACPDVVIPSCAHIFLYLPARWIAKKFNARLIYEVRDIWPLSLIEIVGLSKWHPLVMVMSFIEKNAYKKADAVVSLLPKAFEHMEAKGLDPLKFHYITNGVNANEWKAPHHDLPGEHQKVFNWARKNGKFIIVYAGAHGPPNALEQVLDLKKVLGDIQAPYHFIFIGDGSSKRNLKDRVQRERIDFISFLPRVPKSQIFSAMMQTDACFIGWQKKKIYQYGISPNKLGDYFMAGKPVIHAVQAGNDPVAESGAGITVEPYNPVQLDQALRQLIAMDSEEYKRMGETGKKYALENLEWSVLGKRYAELCEKLVRK